MKVLLDTHALIWHLEASPRLPDGVVELISRTEHERLLSVASLWEIAIKMSMGKLEVDGIAAFDEFLAALPALQVRELGITHDHLDVLATLPLLHRDPFDRLLVAQAIVEGATLLTADPAMKVYAVPLYWA